MAKRIFTNADLRHSRANWYVCDNVIKIKKTVITSITVLAVRQKYIHYSLIILLHDEFFNRLQQLYEEAENEKVCVSEIREVVQNEFQGVTKEETGRIVKYAFPSSQRKRHHSGTNYFYKGIKKRAGYNDNQFIDVPHLQDDQCAKCLENNSSLDTLQKLTGQLISDLDKEKQQNSAIRNELDQVGDRYEQKEIEHAELEAKSLIQKQHANEREIQLKSELDLVRKEKDRTFSKLKEARNLLDSEKHKRTLLHRHAKTSEATLCAEISKTASLNIPVIAQDQLISDPESKAYSKGIGSGTFGDCFLRSYRNIEVCIKYCRQSSYEDVVREAEFIRKLQGHPNLAILFGISHKKEPVPYIVTKFHGSRKNTKNTLYYLLSQKQCQYSANDFIKLALECAKALMHMHNNSILHNDLKTNNVVVEIVNDQPCAVIIDLGKSCYIRNARVKRIPSHERDAYRTRYPHIAPEIVNMSRSKSIASDVFSYGILLQKMNYRCDKKLEHVVKVATEEKPEKRASLDTLISFIKQSV